MPKIVPVQVDVPELTAKHYSVTRAGMRASLAKPPSGVGSLA